VSPYLNGILYSVTSLAEFAKAAQSMDSPRMDSILAQSDVNSSNEGISDDEEDESVVRRIIYLLINE